MRVAPFARLSTRWRRLARVLTAALVLVVVAAVLAVLTVRAPFPQRDGTATLPGLAGEVTVHRDARGVPHLYADTAADLFAAQGYVHAQDRFWEMDVRRHTTAGRLSELFGEATVTEDSVIRTLGWRRVAEQELPLLAPDTRAHLDAYAVGVNAWLAAHPGARHRGLEYVVLALTGVRHEPEPWTALDSLAWLKAMAWDLRTNLPDELARSAAASTVAPERVEQLWPGYPYRRHDPIVTSGAVRDGRFDQAATGPDGAVQPVSTTGSAALDRAAQALRRVPAGIGATGEGAAGIGSNSWVVAGEHTATGAPLLANDPHLGASLPSVWHQVGLHCRDVGPDCPFDVTGFSFAGLPGVVIGRSDRIAWGFTNLGADVMDLYLERVDGSSYQAPDGSAPLEVRTERIAVAGSDPVELTVRSTGNGPIVSDVLGDAGDAAGPDGSNAVSLRWTALDPGRTADALFALNAARDWASFREGLRHFEVPGQNVVYADVEGNIGYQATGRVPIRAGGDGRAPVPGWTGEHRWTGTIPFDELPHVLNPDEGFVVTANNAVVDAREYGRELTADWARGHRSQRIRELVESAIDAGAVDVAAMEEIQADSHLGFADDLVPALLAVPVHPDVEAARDLLRGWDGSQDVDSAPAAYLNAVWRALLSRTFHDELAPGARPGGGDRWFEVVTELLAEPDDPFWDDRGTARVERRDDVLRAALTGANAELTDRLGDDPASWRWGELHRLELVHATFGSSGVAPLEWLFNRGPLETGGSRDAVNATSWDAREGYAVTAVPSMRMVVDLHDLADGAGAGSRWINLTGNSGHPFHPQYTDQAQLWAGHGSVPMVSGRAAVRAAAEHTLVLTGSG